jgi:alpha-D-ribose 1-methylphosphonate 5-triphosphate synthase subunit PhnL
VRVRDVTYKGKWPRQVPPVEAQELAVSPALRAQLDHDKLKDQVAYDFRGQDLDRKLFDLKDDTTGCQSTPDGLRMAVAGQPKKTAMARLIARLGLKAGFQQQSAGF